MSNFRFAIRFLLGRPAFTTIAVLTLALGIGATCAIFAVVYGILLEPLPYDDPDQIFMVWESNPEEGILQFLASPANFVDWREQNQVFQEIAALDVGTTGLAGGGDPVEVQAAYVSEGFFTVFGVPPVVGRDFTAEEYGAESDGVVILSHRLWQTHFGGVPETVGQVLQLDGVPYQVVGILPAEFQFPEEAEVWIPVTLSGDLSAYRGAHYLRVVARLQDGVSASQARSEMALIGQRLADQFPATNEGWTVRLVTLHEQVVGNVRPALLILLGSVVFVLLLACVNVATLVLARTVERKREVAVRIALGADDGNLIRQFLLEGLFLAVLSAAVGLGLAFAGIQILVSLAPDNIPRLEEVGLRGAVMFCAVLLSLVVGFAMSLVSIGSSRKISLVDSLKEGGRSELSSSVTRLSRDALVVIEVALALVLLIGSGLLIRSFQQLQRVDVGFESKDLWTMRLNLPDSRYPELHQLTDFYERLREEASVLPGVQEVALGTSFPFSGDAMALRFTIEGKPIPPSGERPGAGYASVGPGYFKTLGIPLEKGRDFSESDRQDAPPVMIINQAMAEQFWPGEDALGERVVVGRDQEAREVIGIVGNTKQGDLESAAEARMYVPFAQQPWPFLALVARGSGQATSEIPQALRGAVWQVDPAQAVSSILTMEQRMAELVSRPRFNMLLVTLFAFIALLLAVIGVYGLNSYIVAQRRFEIGVRLAMGAKGGDILKLILRQGLRPVAIGAGCGLVVAALVTRFLAALLYEIDAADPLTFVGGVLTLVSVAVVASLVPAFRATQVDPIKTLRSE